MINPFTEINWQPENSDLKKFAKTLLIGFSIIAILFFIINISSAPFKTALQAPLYIIIAAVFISIVAATIPVLLKPLYYVWFFIAACIGIVISNVFLMLFYYFFFSVIAIFLRVITGRDPLKLKKPVKPESFWQNSRKNKSLKSYLRQY